MENLKAVINKQLNFSHSALIPIIGQAILKIKIKTFFYYAKYYKIESEFR